MSEDRSGDPAIGSGSSGDRVDRLTRTIRDQTFPNVKPRDSATLILIDRGATVPKVLLGRRHERHKFMPGKFVFPGRTYRADGSTDGHLRVFARAPHRTIDDARETAERREGGKLCAGGGA